MTVTRLAKYQTEDPFTRIPNAAIQDGALDLKARGLLLVMLSKPNSWRFTERNLADEVGVGRDQLRSAMATLIEAGYVRRRRAPGGPGQPAVVVTEVTDSAHAWPNSEGRETQPPGPDTEGRVSGGRVSGGRETRPRSNEVGSNNGASNEVEVQEPSSPDGDPPVLELVGQQQDDGFDAAWDAYPRRNGRKAGSKAKAQKRWKGLTRAERLQVMQAIDNYARERAPSGNGQYVMDFARFLNTEWETWVEPASATPSDQPRQRPLTALEQTLGEGWA